jgi:hypothetical protein
LSKVNSRENGENSSNLVTLTAGDGQSIRMRKKKKKATSVLQTGSQFSRLFMRVVSNTSQRRPDYSQKVDKARVARWFLFKPRIQIWVKNLLMFPPIG